jgi:hypothetical protein
MKFREFVGEKKIKKIKKKIIETNIGPTEADFLRIVAREYPDGTKIKQPQIPSAEYYLGFILSKKTLKRTFDYIRSWLIRYNVPFKPINPCLTVYLLDNLPSVNSTINNIKKTKWGIVYKPKGTITIIGNDYPSVYDIESSDNMDYIVLDYKPNDYNKKLNSIFDSMGISVVSEYCFVKLFEVQSGVVDYRIYEDMMYSIPKIPNLKLGNTSLIRRK